MIVFRFIGRLGDRIWNGAPMTDAGRQALAESQRDRDSVTSVNLGVNTIGFGIGRV